MILTFFIIIFLFAIPAAIIIVIAEGFTSKRNRNKIAESHNLDFLYSANYEHIAGLPIVANVKVDFFYGTNQITFIKEKQEFSINMDQVDSIDIAKGSDMQAAQGNAVLGFVVFGVAGALIGGLDSTIDYLVITYVNSDGEKSSIILNSYDDPKTAKKVEKEYKSTVHKDKPEEKIQL